MSRSSADNGAETGTKQFVRTVRRMSGTVFDLTSRIGGAANRHLLAATPETCFWGYLDHDEPPVATVAAATSSRSRRSPTTPATRPTC